jgi:hypothetical protein
MLANKKSKEIIYQTPKPNTNSQTMAINQNKTINNMNNLIQKNNNDFNRTGSDIYIKNDKKEEEKKYFNPEGISGIRLLQNGLKNGLIYESDNLFRESGDIFKGSSKEIIKESIIESEDDIPEYDNLSQKIINESL